MAYPNITEIEQRARDLYVDPIVIYAYAGLHGRTPTDDSVLRAFQGQAWGWLQSVGVTDPSILVFLYGYLQAQGGWPPTIQVAMDWLSTRGYWDASRNTLTGKYPSAGAGYPPGGTTTTPPPNTGNCGSGTVWDPSQQKCVAVTTGGGGFDLSAIFNWIKAHPLQTGAVVVGYMVLSKRR